MNIQLKSWLIVLATLVLGILFGILLTIVSMTMAKGAMGRWHGGSHERNPGQHMGWKENGGFGQMLERHLENIVEPTEQQKAQLQPILKKYQDKLEQVMENHLETVHTLMDSLDLDLKNILTPEQLVKWKNRPRPSRGHGWRGHTQGAPS